MAITLDGTSGITTPSITSPLQLSNVALAGTAVAGQFEYNGTAPFFTPMGTQRGIIPGMQYYAIGASGYTTSPNTGVQPTYGVGVTLSSNTQYCFEMYFVLYKTVGTGSGGIISTAFGGTATLNSIAYGGNCAGNLTANSIGISTGNIGFNISAAPSAITNSQTGTPNGVIVRFTGVVSVNAGGTFIPQFSMSTAITGGSYVTQPGSYFAIWPAGLSTTNISVGTWA
jgi:hypothetical protein